MSDRTSAFDVEGRLDEGRAIAALNRVNPSANVTAHIVVDPSERPSAWSWADGTVCVCRGFIRRTSDDELTAVVAHELGHLCLARDGVTGAAGFGFRGDGSQVAEQEADHVAVRLLKHAGLSETSLQNALIIVRDSALVTPEIRKALDVRINLLGEHD